MRSLLYLIALVVTAWLAYWYGWTEAEQRYTTSALCPNPGEIAYARTIGEPLDVSHCPQ